MRKVSFPKIRFWQAVLGLLPWCCAGGPQAIAQNWQYTDLLDDSRQSGQFPSLAADAQGTLHCAYWNARNDKLVYGQRNAQSLAWTWETVNPGHLGGFKPQLVLGASGQAHLAYFTNQAGGLQPTYAVRQGPNNWNLHPVADTVFGDYGPAMQYADGRPQASIALALLPDQSPALFFFDATFEGCDFGDVVGFQLWKATPDAGLTNWQLETYGDMTSLFSFQGFGSEGYSEFCEATFNGMRYGEFCQAIVKPNGLLSVFANTKSDGQVLEFRELLAGSPFNLYDSVIVDDNSRILSAATATPRPHYQAVASIEGLSVLQTPDSAVHMVYATSDNYGRNVDVSVRPVGSGTVVSNFVTMSYLRMNADGTVDTVINFAPGITPAALWQYRTCTQLASKGSDTLFFTVANLSQQRYWLYASYDGGNTWLAPLDIVAGFTPSRMAAPAAVVGDTLHVVYYNPDTDRLMHTWRPADVSAGSWQSVAITQTDDRGAAISTYATAAQPNVLHAAYSDALAQILVYGHNGAGAWMWDTVEAAVGLIPELDLKVDAGTGHAHILYANSTTNRLELASFDAGGWAVSVVNANLAGTSPCLELSADGSLIHTAHRDPTDNRVVYRRRTNSLWASPEEVANDADDVIGEGLAMALDTFGVVHVSYVRQFLTGFVLDSVQVRLARRQPIGTWQTSRADSVPASVAIRDMALRFDATNRPHIGCLLYEVISDTVLVHLVRDAAGTWQRHAMKSFYFQAEAQPLAMQVDTAGRPWFSVGITALPTDEVQLFHLNVAGPSFYPMLVTNNQQNGQIGDVYDFEMAGQALYILGRKQRTEDPGLALLSLADWTQAIPLVGEAEANNLPAGLTATLYPNPVRQAATLSIRTALAQPTVQVLDVQGRVLFTTLAEPGPGGWLATLPCEEMAPGLYVFRVVAQGATAQGKFVRLP